MKPNLPFTVTAVAAAFLSVAPFAPAATYYWKAPDATWGAWADLSNWSTNGVGGADATALPGASDRLFGDVEGNTTRQFDLGGGSWTIGGWSSNGNWLRHNLCFTNGTLLVAGSVSTHSDTVHLDAGASLVLASGTTYTSSYGHGGADQWRVHPGASLSFLCAQKIYNMNVEVDAGATFVLDSSPIGFTSNPLQLSYVHNSGTTVLPSGISFSTGASGATFRIRQIGGTLSVGGDVLDNGMAGTYLVTLEGGTVEATADARFAFGTMSIPAGTTLTNDVASGATLDLTGFSGTADAEITKTGAETAALAEFPAVLVFRGGAVTIPHAADRTLRTLVVESGATFATPCERLVVSNLVLRGTLAITKPGLSAPTGCETGSVSLDLAGFHEGDLVLSTASATLRAKARAAAEAAAAGTNLSIEESGDEIRIAVNPGTHIFNSTTVSDMSDPTGWLGGAVPPAGADVLVSGAGVVAELNAACPAWASIEALEDTTIRLARDPGATALRFEPNAALAVKGGFALTVSETPGTEIIRLEEGSTLALADGATVALTDGFAGAASATNLPALSIPTNATLRVPGGFGFKNVALSASGTIETTSPGDVVFGAASSGETAWFALSLDGARVAVTDGDVCFADPDDGGTVRAAGTWLIRGTTFDHASSAGFNFARNNPTSEVVEIVFDDTVLS